MTLMQVLFEFEGRIGRTTWWLSQVAILVLCVVIGAALVTLAGPWAWIVLLPLYWPLAAINTKRLHDRGKSGWCVPAANSQSAASRVPSRPRARRTR